MIGVETLILWAETYGYFAVFFSGFLSTFSLFLPSPTFVVVFLLGSTLNPFLLGVVGGLGASIGEMIGYFIGYGASKISKKEKKIENIRKLFERYRPSVVIFIFAAAPILPFDLVGLFCGGINYDTKKFFVVTTAGKIVKYLIIAYAGFFGLNWFMNYLS